MRLILKYVLISKSSDTRRLILLVPMLQTGTSPTEENVNAILMLKVPIDVKDLIPVSLEW